MSEYLNGTCQTILRRFSRNEDSLARILARFGTPSSRESATMQSFVRRFMDRVDPALTAYREEKGVAAATSSHALLSLHRLVASGTFVDTVPL